MLFVRRCSSSNLWKCLSRHLLKRDRRGIEERDKDEISSWMLRNFSVELSSSVSSLFNLSIRNGRLPVECKLYHNIVPIPKSTTNHDVGSFRPISLLSLMKSSFQLYLQMSSYVQITIECLFCYCCYNCNHSTFCMQVVLLLPSCN